MRSAAAVLAVSLVLGGLLSVLAAPPAKAATADWTFLVYMDADNNLEDVGIADFLEMARVGSTPRVNIVVQFDRAIGVNSEYGDWTTTKRFLVQRGMTPTPANGTEIGEQNMADPATLVAFVTWGTTTYPARHYFLDLWDHGLGWQGVLLDSNPPGYMTTLQLASALSQIKAVLGRNLDIVGNDACRMTLEIMDEIRPYVDYFVGSEKDEPAEGWPYDTFLGPVVAAPYMTPIQVGTVLTTAYVASYAGTSGYSVALSLVSASALPSLVGTFADFTAELSTSVPLLQAQVIQARLATERYEKNGLSGGDEFDLYHFAENIAAGSGNPRLAARAGALEAAIASAVLANDAWDNPNPVNRVHAAHAHGLSIWFPDVPTDATYSNLSLSRATGWDAFLATYRSGTPTPIPTGATARSVDTAVPPDGLADVIRVDATPPMNGTIFVVLTAGLAIVAAPQILAIANQRETLNLTSPHAGLFNATILYYVAGKLSDLVTVPYLAIQARYRFQGTVTDAGGGFVVGAVVTLRNPRTAVSLSATTNASGGYAMYPVIPDFFLDGDTLVLGASYGGRTTSATFVASPRGTSQTANLVLDASYGGRTTSATFVASPRGTSQTANLVLDTSPPELLNAGLLALAAAGLTLAILLAAVVVWQRQQIHLLRRRLP